MKLYFLRHGEADWPSWKKPDDERPLTKRGKREMREVAKFLDRLKVRPDLIVTSPLPRAAETAAHIGYLNSWRAKHPDRVQKHRARERGDG
jgi:phosphohistidine phosphatase